MVVWPERSHQSLPGKGALSAPELTGVPSGPLRRESHCRNREPRCERGTGLATPLDSWLSWAHILDALRASTAPASSALCLSEWDTPESRPGLAAGAPGRKQKWSLARLRLVAAPEGSLDGCRGGEGAGLQWQSLRLCPRRVWTWPRADCPQVWVAQLSPRVCRNGRKYRRAEEAPSGGRGPGGRGGLCAPQGGKAALPQTEAGVGGVQNWSPRPRCCHPSLLRPALLSHLASGGSLGTETWGPSAQPVPPRLCASGLGRASGLLLRAGHPGPGSGSEVEPPLLPHCSPTVE